MKEEKNHTEDLHEMAPFLAKMEKKNAFKTPDNYFESLLYLNNNKNLENNSLIYYFDKLSWRFFAPILSILVIGFILFINIKNSSNVEPSSDQLNDFMLAEGYLDMDEDLVYEMYAEMIINEENEMTQEEQEYVKYLLENEVDLNTIIEEL